jgi:hypothetical protein
MDQCSFWVSSRWQGKKVSTIFQATKGFFSSRKSLLRNPDNASQLSPQAFCIWLKCTKEETCQLNCQWTLASPFIVGGVKPMAIFPGWEIANFPTKPKWMF